MNNIDINDENEVNNLLLTLSQEKINDFVSIMLSTKNMLVCNKIAYELSAYKDPTILDALVQIIQRKEREGKRGKLIMLCEAYDCTQYLELFVRLAITERGEAYLWSCDVIGNMQGPFQLDQLRSNIDQLEQCISESNDKEKIINLRKVVTFLRDK